MFSNISSRDTYRRNNNSFRIHIIGVGQLRSRWSGRTLPTMMPEGPEVRTLVDQLQPAVGMRLLNFQFLSGRYTRHGKPTGFEPFMETMTPYISSKGNDTIEKPVDTIKEWNAKGKFIYIVLDDDDDDKKMNVNSLDESFFDTNDDDDDDDDDFQRSVWITLGMSGQFINEKTELERRNEGYYANRVGPRWFLEVLDDNDKIKKIYFHDSRNFGTLRFSLSKLELDKKLESLGPDIFDIEGFTEDHFLQIVHEQRADPNVCKFLMNQSKLCGIGNYILAEGLYRANVDPFVTVKSIEEKSLRELFRQLRDVATQSYASQGLSQRTYRDVDGEKGNFSFQLQCYGRDKCIRGNPVTRDINGPHGRTIWYVEDQLTTETQINFQKIATKNKQTKTIQKRKSTITNNSGKSKYNTLNPIHDDSVLIDSINDAGWKDALHEFLNSEKFERLSRFVHSERQQHIIFPPTNDETFTALNLCPLDKVKVVIVGQDPYHGPGQAHGLAFSVKKEVTPPPSLRNIWKELDRDIGLSSSIQHGNLESWAKQGVLLLNSVLTVRDGEANSHANVGWEDFTDEVISIISSRKKNVVFLLWGNPAAKKASGVDQKKHIIIKSSHPSPLSATRTKTPFIGSNCFSRCNEALIQNGDDPIDWSNSDS